MAQGIVKAGDLPQVIPVFPLNGAVLLARGQLPLNIFEPRYLNMIDDAMAGDRMVGMVQTTGGPADNPTLAPVGCVGRITNFAETPDGRYMITLTGICRFRIAEEIPARSPYRQVRADFQAYAADLIPAPSSAEIGRPGLLEALCLFLEHRGLEIDWDTARDAPAEALVNSLCMALPFEVAEKQALVEAMDLTARARALTTLLSINAADSGDEDTPPSLQ